MNTQADDENPPATGSASSDPGVIARRLQYLFDTVRKPDGRRFTYREVLDRIKQQGGPDLSIGYLSQLVTGARTNPMLDSLVALAGFFRVPLSYFDVSKDTGEIDGQLKLAAAMQAAGVEQLATRAAGLPEASIKVVLDMVERLRQIEGLPEPKDG